MKAFAVWYFEWGWIVTMTIGLPVGYYAGRNDRDWTMAAYLLAVLFFNLICLYFKYS